MPDAEKALRWAKWDVWFNSGVVLAYILLTAWQVERAVNYSGWNWIAVVLYCGIMAIFARNAKKAFQNYINIKERK